MPPIAMPTTTRRRTRRHAPRPVTRACLTVVRAALAGRTDCLVRRATYHGVPSDQSTLVVFTSGVRVLVGCDGYAYHVEREDGTAGSTVGYSMPQIETAVLWHATQQPGGAPMK